MYITGIGIYTGKLESKKARLKFLQEINHPREDRAMVNSVVAECLKSAKMAFNMPDSLYSQLDKDNCCVYASCELDIYPIPYLYDFIVSSLNADNLSSDKIDKLWSRLGNYRDKIHPLLTFQGLITSVVYHLSKHFGLRGEGYPISSMSMSGLIMLELLSTNYSISNFSTALLCSHGDMSSQVYKNLFEALGLVKRNNGETSKLSKASVSLLVEKNFHHKQPLGRVMDVKSRYFSKNYISFYDWINFYEDYFKEYREKGVTFILYGQKDTHKQEYEAAKSFFNPKKIKSYRDVYGYTGSSNTFVNIFCALNDKDISKGSVLIINCMGLFSGIGSIAFLKKEHIN